MTFNLHALVLAGASLLLVAASATPPPEELPMSTAAPAPAAAGHDLIGIELMPKVGGLVPWSKLGLTWNVDLEVGYLLPVLDRQLAVVVDVGYAQPTHSQTVTDTRVGGGSYTDQITQRQLQLFIGPKYFIFDTNSQWLPFVAAGVKLHLLRSEIVGSANGQPFGENDETSTQVGGAVRGGLGFKLGPGHLAAELEVAYAGLHQTVTGDTDSADVSLQVGYVFLF